MRSPGPIGAAGVLRFADQAVTRWKNGAGLTRELACSPPGATLEQFDWRISLAEVEQPGAFSVFPGIDRAIVLLDGAGMTLTVDGAAHPLTALRPFRFDGDSETSCALVGGPTRDLNVMTRRGRCQAKVEVVAVTNGTSVFCGSGSELLIVSLSGTPITLPTDPALIELAPLDAVHAAGGCEVRFQGYGQAIIIEIEDVRSPDQP